MAVVVTVRRLVVVGHRRSGSGGLVAVSLVTVLSGSLVAVLSGSLVSVVSVVSLNLGGLVVSVMSVVGGGLV